MQVQCRRGFNAVPRNTVFGKNQLGGTVYEVPLVHRHVDGIELASLHLLIYQGAGHNIHAQAQPRCLPLRDRDGLHQRDRRKKRNQRVVAVRTNIPHGKVQIDLTGSINRNSDLGGGTHQRIHLSRGNSRENVSEKFRAGRSYSATGSAGTVSEASAMRIKP